MEPSPSKLFSNLSQQPTPALNPLVSDAYVLIQQTGMAAGAKTIKVGHYQ
jgi:hypothetical protein